MAERIWSSPRMFLSLSGDKDAAGRLERKARSLVGYLFDQLRPGQTYRTQRWRLPNEATIAASVWRDVIGERALVRIHAPGEEGEEYVLHEGGFLFVPQDDTQSWARDFLKLHYRYSTDAPELLSLPTYILDTDKVAGPVSWFPSVDLVENGQSQMLSYDHGLGSRYRIHPEQDCSGRVTATGPDWYEYANDGETGLWYQGVKYATTYTDEAGEPDEHTFILNVVGAAKFADRFIIVSHMDPTWRPDDGESSTENEHSRHVANSTKAAVFAGVLVSDPAPDPEDPSALILALSLVATHDYEVFMKSPWFFMPNGGKGTAIEEVNHDNQYRLDINLSLDEDTGEIEATFSREALDNIQVRFDINTDPVSVDQPTSAPYYDGDNWVHEMRTTGNVTIYNDWDYDQYVVSYDTGWVTIGGGAGPEDSKGVIDGAFRTAHAAVLAWSEGIPDSGVFVCRIEQVDPPVGTSYLDNYTSALTEARNKVPDSVGITLTFFLNCWGNPTAGRIDIKSWRPRLLHVSWDSDRLTTTPYEVAQGKRFFAIDYDPDGAELVGSVSLEVETPFKSTLRTQDFYSTLYTKASYEEGNTEFTRRLIHTHEAEGSCSWAVRNNDKELFRLSGGFMELYRKEISSWDNRYWETTAPGDISVERGWLTDCDLRTDSYILEKRNTQLIPTNDPNEDLDRWDNSFETSYLRCNEYQEDRLIVGVYGEVVLDEIRKERTKTINSFELWMWGFPTQLMPRFYSCDNGYEEQVGEPTRYYKFVPISAGRYEYPWTWDFYPVKPVSGQLQSRFSDVVVSAADWSMSWTKGLVEYELTYFEERPPVWGTFARIGGNTYPILENLHTELVDAAESEPGENFRLTQIAVV